MILRLVLISFLYSLVSSDGPNTLIDSDSSFAPSAPSSPLGVKSLGKWTYSSAIAGQLLVIFLTSVFLAWWLLYVLRRKQRKNLGAWSRLWAVAKYDADPWNWHIVLNFIHHWHRRTIEEKIRFIEKGYSELSFKSSITQMFYIFEYMLMAESSCFVWRPMLAFILRMKRLVSPGYCELKLIHKFDSYLSFKGQQLMDEFGFMEGDATESNTCSTDPSRSMTLSDLNEMGDEDDYSLSSEDTLDDLISDDTEEKSKKSKKSESSSRKKGKGKRKRGGAGGDDPVKKEEMKKDGATPVVVKMEEANVRKWYIAPKKSEVPDEKTDNQAADGHSKKNDDPDGFCRFVGVWLMMMGADGRDTTVVLELRELYDRGFYDLTGPIIGPLGALEIRRAVENGEYERLFDRITSAPDMEEDKEWGSVWEHSFYALGSIIDEKTADVIMKYLLEEQAIQARHIVAWFRGAIDRGSRHPLPFIFRDFKLLTRKMKMHTPEFYEIMKIYCFQEHTPSAWDTVERLVLKDLSLTRKLNVPEYRRRSEHFTAHFMWHGSQELEHFLRNPQRRADIKEAEYVNLEEFDPYLKKD